ncbi:MAG: CBS domain-containing protein [Legionellales bacterium]|nr:CBS domain-containing protein [Legionellales bacterium]
MSHIRSLLKPQTVQILSSEDTVAKAAEVMAAKKIGSVVIMENNQLAGIFTERDLLTKIIANKQDPDVVKLCDVMTRRVKTVTPDTTVGECFELMRDIGCRHLPVMNEDNTVYAIVSIRHVLGWTIDELQYERDQLARYIQS